MSNYDKFLESVKFFIQRHAGGNWPGFDVLDEVGIFQLALSIPPECIPDNWARAAQEFCYHVTHLGYPDERKPPWLPDGLIDYDNCRKNYKSDKWGRSLEPIE